MLWPVSLLLAETLTDWRAGCGKSARPVRRGEAVYPASYLYPASAIARLSGVRPK